MFELCGTRLEGIVQEKGELLLREGRVREYGIGTGMEREDGERLTEIG